MIVIMGREERTSNLVDKLTKLKIPVVTSDLMEYARASREAYESIDKLRAIKLVNRDNYHNVTEIHEDAMLMRGKLNLMSLCVNLMRIPFYESLIEVVRGQIDYEINRIFKMETK